MSREDVEFLLKSQESNMKTLINNTVTHFEIHLTDNMTSYEFDIMKVQNVSRD